MSWVEFLLATSVPTDQAPASLWAGLIAIILALIAVFKDVLKEAFGSRKPEKVDPLGAILSELARAMNENALANGRLADVLERIETAQEKAWERVGGRLEEHSRVLQGIDYRTKEILKNLERRATET